MIAIGNEVMVLSWVYTLDSIARSWRCCFQFNSIHVMSFSWFSVLGIH